MTTKRAAGVRLVDGWRLVEAVDQGRVDAWRQAQAAYDAAEPAWRARTAAYQRERGVPRRRVQSPHSKALVQAEAAVVEKFEEMLASGQIVFAGYRSGQLGDSPEVIPLALLAGKRPRGSQCTIRGTTFHDVKLYPAAAAPEPEPVPPATLPALVAALVELFREDPAWAVAGTSDLARAVAARDARFRPHDGPARAGRWRAATLRQRIRECRVEAREAAAT